MRPETAEPSVVTRNARNRRRGRRLRNSNSGPTGGRPTPRAGSMRQVAIRERAGRPAAQVGSQLAIARFSSHSKRRGQEAGLFGTPPFPRFPGV